MDSSHYRDCTTSRGLSYHYYFSAAKDQKPTITLLHGFPSSSFDWHNQVTHLEQHGYGVIVPDMLGYGGTAKPVDPSQYQFKLVVKDIVDIIDAEGVERVVVVGHDWGSAVAARLANYYPEHFIGFGFLAVGYFPPTDQKYEHFVAAVRQVFNRDIFGYQAFFAASDGPPLCEKNFESFYSLIHPRNSETLWPEFICPPGATRKWVEGNKQTELDPHIPAEDHAFRKEILRKNGLVAPMCWYKVQFADLEVEESKQIPLSAYTIEKPVFLGLAEKDTVTSPLLAKDPSEKWCKNLTVRSFSGAHWLIWENKDELNAELTAWLSTL